jgi:hypothetical protein
VPAYTLRVAINGSETDVDVENDDADWLTKIANLRTTDGGGTWFRAGNQAAAALDLNIPLAVADAVRTVTIAVQGPHDGGGGASDYLTSVGGGLYYRVIFHGTVVAKKAVVGEPLIQIDAISEMQQLLERRARTAASNNSGPRAVTTDIETAHSLTIPVNTAYPLGTDFYTLDRPAQKGASNGEWLKKALAGTGCNPTAEWNGPITAPELCWRVDYAWTVGMRNQQLEATRPWAYSYPDVGTTWQDFPARVEVEGENSAGTQHYGWARLGDSSIRTQLGNQSVSLSTWIDTAAECETAAATLLGHIGEPDYLRMFRVGFYPDFLLSEMTGNGVTEATAQVRAMDHACAMPGDFFVRRNPFDDTHSEDWPSVCPVGSDRYDDLEALWVHPVRDNGVSSGNVLYYGIRTVNRWWTPTGGWYLEVSAEPDGTLTPADSGNGTY